MGQLLVGVASILFFGVAFVVFSTDKKEEVDWRYRLGSLVFVLIGIWMVIDSGLLIELIGFTFIVMIVLILVNRFSKNTESSSATHIFNPTSEYKEKNPATVMIEEERKINKEATKEKDILQVSNDPLISELNENVKVKYPLDEDVYMGEGYIHPTILSRLSLIKEQNEYKYNEAKRTVINNNKRMNKTNSYHRDLIATNKYHEMEFPVIGIRPDLEEFTDERVWDDEKIYYHSRAREYVTYDIPDHYVTTSSRFGSVNIGNISKISGKKDVGWASLQRGEFYITERQLLIFDKGPSRFDNFINAALAADQNKRLVYWFTWPEIDYVEGNIKEGTLLIGTSGDKHKQHKFIKIDESNQNIGFTKDELRYLVNLIGSLIENTFY